MPVRFGPKPERKQMVLFRAVDIGAELFAMAASCSRAVMLSDEAESAGGGSAGRMRFVRSRASGSRIIPAALYRASCTSMSSCTSSR